MKTLKNISKPTLIIDREKCLKNIERMAQKAKDSNLIFRPHFKTHYSAEVGEWFRYFGVEAITVSSVSMAKYFYENGWRNITIAFPVNILEIDGINELAKDAEINLLVISRETLKFLEKNLESKVGVFVKIDTGYHRTGVAAENIEELDALMSDLNNSKKLLFKGFLTHSGNTYHADSKNEILSIHDESKKKLVDLKKRYSSMFKCVTVSIGDTPSCSIATDFSDIDEIRPGNFVYYDLMQYQIGSCTIDDIAVCVACPVVGKEKIRNEVFIYAGAVHLSKENLQFKNGIQYYGLIVRFNDKGWSEPLKNTYLAKISQEHGIIKTDDDNFDSFNTGELIGVLPVHSCLTANLLKREYRII